MQAAIQMFNDSDSETKYMLAIEFLLEEGSSDDDDEIKEAVAKLPDPDKLIMHGPGIAIANAALQMPSFKPWLKKRLMPQSQTPTPQAATKRQRVAASIAEGGAASSAAGEAASSATDECPQLVEAPLQAATTILSELD